MAESGRLWRVKIGDGATSETFTAIAGARDEGINLSREMVDITNKDSSGKRTLGANYGTFSGSVECSGVFVDGNTAGFDAVRTAMINGTENNYEIVHPSGDKYSGAFQVENLSHGAVFNGEVTFSFTLQSSGAITFAAA